ncbi:hypothetical protein JH06_2522 [Blastocystis sp. subtype 4]|uniref:hypothetical protein n=1 Tax=Blastocystis sp. subtype 4 TaxID=944170 RepID=UPI000711D48A|nr:hypothetical protein JH06_2522 [Blastocystis sp. subtype 4]KNB44661.1 hypothetical protein JH06_2522 [Blastocystis sp. subtype 4]|eukprot:XP_014528098.1 hypothetical protein JH06_2522 [Blastocystis sp. subtype 4]
MSDPKERQVHGPNWYLSLYRANDELRCNSHRIIPVAAENPRSCVVQLIRTIKRARMFQVLWWCEFGIGTNWDIETEPLDEKKIESVNKMIEMLESMDIFAVAKHMLPILLMIEEPKNYQKPIDEDKKRCQDLLIDSRLMRVFVEKMHQLKSIPRHVVDVDSIESVAKEAIQTSSKEVLQDEKKRPLKLEEMTRKQRRAAEYRIMKEAETKSSQFITSLNSGSRMGSASSSSRKEAARKALMGMELPDRIREKVQRGDASEEVTKERMKGSKKTAGVKSSKRVEKQKPQTKEKEESKMPEHPSWAAQKESKEKMRIHIDPTAPKENKRITFD